VRHRLDGLGSRLHDKPVCLATEQAGYIAGEQAKGQRSLFDSLVDLIPVLTPLGPIPYRLFSKLTGRNPGQIAEIPPGMAEEEYLDMLAAGSKWARGLSAAMSGTGIEPAECKRRMARHLIREALLK